MKRKGRDLLEEGEDAIKDLEILAPGFEHSKRKVQVIKAANGYRIFKELISFHIARLLISSFMQGNQVYDDVIQSLPAKPSLTRWKNLGGQLVLETETIKLIERIRNGRCKSWEDVHRFYVLQAEKYDQHKLAHAMAAYQLVFGKAINKMTAEEVSTLLEHAVKTKEWMVEGIYKSRAKDYQNPFRKMVYSHDKEMETVIGKLEDNSFIQQEQNELKKFKRQVEALISNISRAPSRATKTAV